MFSPLTRARVLPVVAFADAGADDRGILVDLAAIVHSVDAGATGEQERPRAVPQTRRRCNLRLRVFLMVINPSSPPVTPVVCDRTCNTKCLAVMLYHDDDILS